MKTYKSYSDSGHGWLAVKYTELVELGIEGKVTRFSYQRGQTVYLEEDCDVSTFWKAYTLKHGVEPLTVHKSINGSSPIRSYDPYRATAGEGIENQLELGSFTKSVFEVG
jgi:hypothetical protein